MSTPTPPAFRFVDRRLMEVGSGASHPPRETPVVLPEPRAETIGQAALDDRGVAVPADALLAEQRFSAAPVGGDLRFLLLKGQIASVEA